MDARKTKIVRREVGPAAKTAMIALATGLQLLLAGCAANTGANLSTSSPVVTATKVSGIVHGGQQPVVGATIQLWGVNTTTTKGASASLLTNAVTTVGGGGFDITNDYPCTGNPLVYITATGGNPGGGTNPNLAMMAVLESCNTLQANAATTHIFIDEVTTVAAAYVLAPFMAGYDHVGASTAYSAGLANAFQLANSLVNLQTGQPGGPGLPANATLPTAEINTLSNIISACVNSIGGVAKDMSNCGNLFQDTTPPGGNAPTDTIMAAANIAQNPGQYVSAIYALSPSSPPFGSPVLMGPPHDWTVALTYGDTSLSTPYGIAIDASGDAWVANESGVGITELSPIGTVLSTSSTGFTGSGNVLGPQAISVDRTGNIWVANTAGNSIVKLNSTGGFVAQYKGSSISGPVAIANDSGGNAWLANYNGGSLIEVSSAGVVGSAITGSGANGTLSNPTGLTVDSSGNIWVSNSGPSYMVEFNHSGTLVGSFTDNSLLEPLAVGVDSSNNIWVAANAISGVSSFAHAGTALTTSPAIGGGLSAPTGLAVDGAGNVWVTNSNTAGTISEVNSTSASALTPTTGLGSLNVPVGVAVDAGGNIWTANSGNNTVTELVGLASPTVPPSQTAGP